jgi:hypothetical protein
MLIWYIHGANSTPLSFSYIAAQLPKHDARYVAYTHDIPLPQSIERIVDEIASTTEPFAIVAHSLGGIIAHYVTEKSNPTSIVTLSSPFGGSKGADLLRWMYPSNNLFDDIRPGSSVMKHLKNIHPSCPVHSVVTYGGKMPMIPGENDGVVSVDSQTCLSHPTYHRLPINHFEVLLSDEVIHLIATNIGLSS